MWVVEIADGIYSYVTEAQAREHYDSIVTGWARLVGPDRLVVERK